jgi:hypothetical protein
MMRRQGWVSSIALTLLVALPAVSDQTCPCSDPKAICVCAVDADAARTGRPVGVFVIRDGDFTRRPLTPGVELNVGDEIAADGVGAEVQLRCPGSGVVNVSAGFRTIVLPPRGDNACAFHQLSGQIDVQSDVPTRTESGEVIMGSLRTQYALRVVRGRAGARREIVLFEGAVQVQAAGAPKPAAMMFPAKMLVEQGATRTEAIAPADIARTAGVFARLDIARVAAAGRSVPIRTRPSQS